jgi:acetylornithine/N-succinyldiaminopimelate aminotransferase
MTYTDRYLARARAHMTPNYAPAPFVADRGDGVWLWDIEGRRYLDFVGGIGVNALGHAHPEIAEAIAAQAKRLLHTGPLFYNATYIDVCERLARHSFGTRAFLSNSGTEAVEAAMKLARRWFFTRNEPRAGFVSTHGSFHGRTLGGLSLTGQPTYQSGFGPLLPDVTMVPFGDADAMAKAIGPTTAAVILEPIQGNSGVRLAPPGYLARVRELCTKAGCLLIFDEVQVGMARTGRWWAHEHDGVTPDIMTVAKAIGGGLPLGAMVTTDGIAQALGPGTHGSTFGGNPVACAAALKTFEIIERDGLVERTARIGELFAAKLRQLADELPGKIAEVRGRGLITGVVVKEPAKVVRDRCREQGLLVTTGTDDVIRMLPPLIVEEKHLDESIGLLRAALQAP